MPPVLFAALSYPFTQLAHLLFPAAMANGIIAGAFVFCEYLPFAPFRYPQISVRCAVRLHALRVSHIGCAMLLRF